MTETDILQIAQRGEDSLNQFKRVLANEKQAAAEMAAFANAFSGTGVLRCVTKGYILLLNATFCCKISATDPPRLCPSGHAHQGGCFIFRGWRR